MNKVTIPGLIVVEGKTDIDFLSSFLDTNFYSVNGSAVNEKDVDFIKKAKEKMNVIILTDPDFPGMQIRNFLNEHIEGLENAYVRKFCSIKHHKVGVAESTKDEVLHALENVKLYENRSKKSDLELYNLMELGLSGENSKEFREKFTDFYCFGYSNAKQLYKKLTMLGVSFEELKEMIANVK